LKLDPARGPRSITLAGTRQGNVDPANVDTLQRQDPKGPNRESVPFQIPPQGGLCLPINYIYQLSYAARLW
jgi:hypothetical protein